MYFYRDSEGNEIDLLLPMGGKLHAIDVKIGATVNSDDFTGLKILAAITPKPWQAVAWCMTARKANSAATGLSISGSVCYLNKSFLRHYLLAFGIFLHIEITR
jgi:hypothetical protein